MSMTCPLTPVYFISLSCRFSLFLLNSCQLCSLYAWCYSCVYRSIFVALTCQSSGLYVLCDMQCYVYLCDLLEQVKLLLLCLLAVHSAHSGLEMIMLCVRLHVQVTLFYLHYSGAGLHLIWQGSLVTVILWLC